MVRLLTLFPKFLFAIAPQRSPPDARLSCAAELVRSQSGMKLRFPSVHARVVWVTVLAAGLAAAAIWSDARLCRYLLTLTFSAVLPLPNKSYTAPTCGVRSLRLRFFCAGNVRFRVGVNAVGPRCDSAKLFA